VTVNGTKMGKSLGNFINLKDIFKRFAPVVIRFFILQSHYRSPLDFSETAIDASRTGLEKLQDTWTRLQQAAPGSGEIETRPFQERLTEAMNDDFNTPIAIAVLFDLAKAVNTAIAAPSGLNQDSLDRCISLFRSFGEEVLGILQNPATEKGKTNNEDEETLDTVMNLLIDIRSRARSGKDYELSDLIRDKLAEAGITMKDTREGTEWSRS